MRNWHILIFLATCLVFVSSAPSTDFLDDKYPAMIPVSSTVIPLLHLFGKPKPLHGGVTQKPRSVGSTAGSNGISAARRMRLLERSRRPEEPVRLITKNSKQKDLVNDTH